MPPKRTSSHTPPVNEHTRSPKRVRSEKDKSASPVEDVTSSNTGKTGNINGSGAKVIPVSESEDYNIPKNGDSIPIGASAAQGTLPDQNDDPSDSIDPAKSYEIPFYNEIGAEITTIYVGSEAVLFRVPKKLLCAKVPYFEKLLDENGNILKLEDDSPECFGLLLEWVYNNRLRMLKSRLDEESRTYKTSWNPIALYSFARKLDLGELMDRIIDLMRQVDFEQNSHYDARAIRWVFHGDALCDEISDLQSYVVELTVYIIRTAKTDSDPTIDTTDLLDLMQIEMFAEEFIFFNRQNEAIDPRKTSNACIYHTHEEKFCRAQKYSPKYQISTK
ncbi:hypothetical protein OCU04_011056 [Sclerotinia nivalis]|uniref:BTB domain-containing protein n=1 Tax=Sclerotinia nivalis TaxID=352851 RepID=A0A9X0DGF3_9HELO|nr:hypothetical protein OCU04_011056 [Sclerotinia nivalis]